MPNYTFADFTNAGNLTTGNVVVGLANGKNARFTFTGGVPTTIPVPINEGGTGADTAAGARTDLNVPSLDQVLLPTVVTSNSVNMVANTAYCLIYNSGLITLTLPSSGAIGDLIQVVGYGSGGWVLAQNASQTIHMGNMATTSGVGGSLASTNRYDSITLRNVNSSGQQWICIASVGNITVT